MSTPSLDERKEFWLWNYARHCFKHVIQSLDFLEKSATTPPDPVRRVLTTGIVVTYAKPFTSCHGVQRLREDVVPNEHKNLHQAMMGFRHKMMAHIDAEDFQPDDPSFGNINQVRVTVYSGHYTAHVMAPDSDLLTEALELKGLARQLLEKADYHKSKFAKRYIARASLPSGEYLLSIDPKDSVAFVPAKPIYKHPSDAFKK